MNIIGVTLKMQLYHPDIDEKMPRIEGKTLRIVEAKKFKSFGCIVKLSRPFDKKNFIGKEAQKIVRDPEYAILSSEKNNFNELLSSGSLNLGFTLIVNNRVLKMKPDEWERSDFKSFSFSETSLKR